MASFSFTAYGAERCTGYCSYCSCATIENYAMGVKKDVDALKAIDDYVFEKQYKTNWNKVEQTLRNNPQIINDLKKEEGARFVHVDIWGADPVANLRMTSDMVAHLTDIFIKLGYPKEHISFSDSTNGIALLRDDICEWHQRNNVHIQLSHDGLGQFVRTRDIDVLEFPNVITLTRDGILNAINCTLSFYNPDICKNVSYWTEWLKKVWPVIYDNSSIATPYDSNNFKKMYIKLNHIYNGTPPVNTKNTMGIWNGKVYEQLKGQPYGDFNLVNDEIRAEKYNIPEMAHVLDDYIHSYRMLLPNLGRMELIPFYSYFSEQVNRFKVNADQEVVTGACRAYQRWKHDIGDKRSQREYTFVIDSLGEYSECNLIYSKYSVKNPGGVQPEYCSNCVYKNCSECMPCGCEPFPTKCHYNYVWENFLEEFRNGVYTLPPRFDKVNNLDNIKSTVALHKLEDLAQAGNTDAIKALETGGK